jgi:hypothetical protein
VIERSGNTVTITFQNQREAEHWESILRAFIELLQNTFIRLLEVGLSPSSTPTNPSPAGPSEPLKHRMPLSPATCAELERREFSRRNLKEFDRIAPNPSGEAYLPPGRRK